MEQSVKKTLSRSSGWLRKLRRVSGLTLIMLLAIVINVQASIYSESVKFDLKMKKASLKEVFQTITDQSEFKFIYNNNIVDDKQKVSVTTEGARVEEILDEILPKQNLEYKVIDRQVIVFPAEEKENTRADEPAVGQQGSVTGKVVDEDGAPLPGVTVIVKGTTVGVVTNLDGDYTLTNIPADATTLAFSFVGMKTQEISIAGQSIINVTLETEAIGLEEIITVGYATQKKANIVGSVTSVAGDKIESIPAADVSNAISGRLPGAVVIQDTGEPGQNDARIRVRGRTTLGGEGNVAPLVVVDGIPGRSLSEIDPIDIESISVLKDASAAIYGATAANGVILVTTKSGQTGKPTMNYQFYQGWMTPTVLPEHLNAGDYATMLSEYQDAEGKARTYSDEDIALYYSGRDPWEHPNSRWMDDLVQDWTTTGKHNFSITGGTANGMNYFVSLGYKNEEAIYKAESTSYSQYNIRAKLNLPINNWLTTNIDYAGFMNERKYPVKSAGSIYGQATRLLPTQWSYWPSGEPGPDVEYGDNPVVTSTFEGGYDDETIYRNQFTFKATIEPPMVQGLAISGQYTFDVDNEYRKQFRKPWILYFPIWESAVRDSEGFITSMDLTPTPRGYSGPELDERYDRNIRKLGIISANYDRTFGDHTVNLFGAYEQLTDDHNYFGAFRKYYISDVVQTLDAGADAEKNNWGSMSIYARKSWIARANYNYKGKYLAEFVFRRDGSLKFPPDSRWGNFPGFLVGWRASEENFWQDNLSFINYFKLRASYGKMGMDPGNPFQYLNKYQLATGMTFGTGKVVETVVQQAGVANPNITWETQTTYNIGFDSQFLNNLISLNTEFFYSKRADILAPRDASVPGFTGLALPDENIAEVDNRGFEIEAGYHKQINNDFRIDLTGNIAYNHNEVVFMDEPERAVPWQQRTGHPYGATLLFNAIGIFKDQAAVDAYPSWSGAQPGDVIYEDVSGDGVINNDDRILLDKTDAPEIFYGVSLDVTWKNWNLTVLAQGQGEYQRLNIADGRRGEAGNYMQWEFDGRWTPENTDATTARAYNRADLYWTLDGGHRSTYLYDNMAYCRLKNAVLTYNIPSSYVQKVGLSRASIYFAGNNLFLIYAAQKNFDPEIGAPLTYPAVRTLALGVRVTF